MPFSPAPRARRTDPATSHAAADRVGEFAAKQHATILSLLPFRGATVHELAAMCDMDAHSIGKRMVELERARTVQVAKDAEGAEICRPGPSGRMCRVWWPLMGDA